MPWNAETLYLACAVVGGSALVLQVAMALLGGHHDIDMDIDHDVDSDVFFGVLSLKSVGAFLTFFGLAGWGATGASWGAPLSLLVATAAGLFMLAMVILMLRMQRHLSAVGNLDPELAVGSAARVYLRIPAIGEGAGKVTVSIQGRSIELNATTTGEGIPTGANVYITRMITPDTFEVQPMKGAE